MHTSKNNFLFQPEPIKDEDDEEEVDQKNDDKQKPLENGDASLNEDRSLEPVPEKTKGNAGENKAIPVKRPTNSEATGPKNKKKKQKPSDLKK